MIAFHPIPDDTRQIGSNGNYRPLADIPNTHDDQVVTRSRVILAIIGLVISGLIAEAYFGSTRYGINGVTYFVPHRYEMLRQFRLPWLDQVRGLDKEPDHSVWLAFPANELARGISGYSRWFQGYFDKVEADMRVNVLGGKEAREFPGDRENDLAKVKQELSKKGRREADPSTGWERVYWNEEAVPSGSLFYLIPRAGLDQLPSDWRVPYCSRGVNDGQRYDCIITIYRNGVTFGFHIRSENLSAADRIPDYTIDRLHSWRG